METRPKYIVYFDGKCNLCNGAVKYIITRDKSKSIFFASLQSEFASLNLDPIYIADLSSIIVSNEEDVFTESNAILDIANKLGYPYRILIVTKVVPKVIRDFIYKWVSKNRYKWFGKQDECMLPKPEWKAQFID